MGWSEGGDGSWKEERESGVRGRRRKGKSIKVVTTLSN